ncbi:N-acetyltransferase [Acinetobacter tianfuensis]|uniref:N-acetyltransferase n=1 Tax=Acinetobacter tianfuensis TaxID=2419603 RepID=A0A3A8EBL4_9GAMM|nr:N-acetyltransferase [Acinetobacter tianfuensis]
MFHYRKAELHDVAQLQDLINSAYRSQNSQSWTSECSMVDGDRIDALQLDCLLAKIDFELWVLEEIEGCAQDEMPHHLILGCIGIQFEANTAEIGTFAVLPELQNKGLGKTLLDFAEGRIKMRNEIIQIVMYVLHLRKELIDYYLRRGYQRTLQTEQYPLHLNVGRPIQDIHLIQLIKFL